MIRYFGHYRLTQSLTLLAVICLVNSGMTVAKADSVLSKHSEAESNAPHVSQDDGASESDGDEDTTTDSEDNGSIVLEPNSSVARIAGAIESVLKVVPGLANEIYGSLADPSHISSTAHNDNGIALQLNLPTGASLSLPADSGNSVSMSNVDGIDLSLKLPGQAVKSQSISSTALVYEEVLASTHIVAYAKSDSAVRLLLLIDDSNAPTEFRFPINLDYQEALKPLEDGRVAIVSGENIVMAVVNTPWAYDSTGNQIPGNFRIEGNSLVFEVDHSQTTSYPVIADPDFDWGWTSGTIYFSRYETEDIAVFGTSTLMGYIAVLTAIPGVITTLIGLLAFTILAYAVTAYYKSNTCLKVKIGLSWSFPGGLNPFVNPDHYQCDSR